jgi:hypothetical protein
VVDTILHHDPDALRDIEEVLLKTLALGAHITSGSVHG